MSFPWHPCATALLCDVYAPLLTYCPRLTWMSAALNNKLHRLSTFVPSPWTGGESLLLALGCHDDSRLNEVWNLYCIIFGHDTTPFPRVLLVQAPLLIHRPRMAGDKLTSLLAHLLLTYLQRLTRCQSAVCNSSLCRNVSWPRPRMAVDKTLPLPCVHFLPLYHILGLWEW